MEKTLREKIAQYNTDSCDMQALIESYYDSELECFERFTDKELQQYLIDNDIDLED